MDMIATHLKTLAGIALAALATPAMANPEAEGPPPQVTVSTRPPTPEIGTAKLAEPPSDVTREQRHAAWARHKDAYSRKVREEGVVAANHWLDERAREALR